jgi:hypothetical protein
MQRKSLSTNIGIHNPPTFHISILAANLFTQIHESYKYITP